MTQKELKNNEQKKPSYLFSLSFENGELDSQYTNKIIIKNIKEVIAFSDRPHRISKKIEIDDLVDLWYSEDENSFKNNHPNACLYLNKKMHVIELLEAKIIDENNNKVLIFTYKHLNYLNYSSEPISKSFDNGCLVIDTIFIGNLSWETEEDDLHNLFSEYGNVANCKIITDRETGRKRGFGFVYMESESDEKAAIDGLQGTEWMGRNIRVNKSRPR